MSGPNPLWRAILWVERFLPAPAVAGAGHADTVRRRGRLLPIYLLLPVIMPMLIRQQPRLGELVDRNRIAFEELAMLVAGIAIVAIVAAAIVFGKRAWRDAKEPC